MPHSQSPISPESHLSISRNLQFCILNSSSTQAAFGVSSSQPLESSVFCSLQLLESSVFCSSQPLESSVFSSSQPLVLGDSESSSSRTLFSSSQPQSMIWI
ncbi:hypothetical protein Dimus_027082 [Dionaea muscipula]